MRPRISIRGSVRPSVRPSVRRSVRPSVRRSVGPSVRRSVRPERVFSNEPIMDENSRKWLGKQSKWSQLVKMSSELSLNVPKCLKMSKNVKKCPEPIMGENGPKWLGKQSKCSKLVKKSSGLSQNVPKCPKMPQNVPIYPLQAHRCPNGLVSSFSSSISSLFFFLFLKSPRLLSPRWFCSSSCSYHLLFIAFMLRSGLKASKEMCTLSPHNMNAPFQTLSLYCLGSVRINQIMSYLSP